MEFPSGSAFAIALEDSNNCYLQNFNLSINFNRDKITELGSIYPKNRPVIYPIEIGLQAEALMNQYKIDKLSTLLCNNTGFDINIILKQPCSQAIAAKFILKGLKLESQSVSSSLSGPQTASFTWRGFISNPFSLTNNLFILSNQGNAYYQLIESRPISGYDQYGVLYFDQEDIYQMQTFENIYEYSR
jgi:hypothetical protein